MVAADLTPQTPQSPQSSVAAVIASLTTILDPPVSVAEPGRFELRLT